MKVTIRADKVVIEGYVNAVERLSKPLVDNRGRFVERILAGAFARAITKANGEEGVFGLLNHDPEQILGNTKDGSVTLKEDNIGLYARVETSYAKVIQKAREGKLVGWSFGFNNPKQSFEAGKNGMEERTISDLTLVEVSVLDDEKVPAYYGTSIESRATDDGEEITITETRAEIVDQTDYVTIREDEGGEPASKGSGKNEEEGDEAGGEEADEDTPDLTEHKARINKLTLQGVEENE